jgi:hypothetical protein
MTRVWFFSDQKQWLICAIMVATGLPAQVNPGAVLEQDLRHTPVTRPGTAPQLFYPPSPDAPPTDDHPVIQWQQIKGKRLNESTPHGPTKN